MQVMGSGMSLSSELASRYDSKLANAPPKLVELWSDQVSRVPIASIAVSESIHAPVSCNENVEAWVQRQSLFQSTKKMIDAIVQVICKSTNIPS